MNADTLFATPGCLIRTREIGRRCLHADTVAHREIAVADASTWHELRVQWA